MQLYSAVMELYIFSSVGAVTPDLTLIIVIHQTSTGDQPTGQYWPAKHLIYIALLLHSVNK